MLRWANKQTNKKHLNVLIDMRSLALLSPQHPSESRIPAEQNNNNNKNTFHPTKKFRNCSVWFRQHQVPRKSL